MQRQEAAVAGRLARVTQQAVQQEEELQELRVSLQADEGGAGGAAGTKRHAGGIGGVLCGPEVAS